jgi:selenocysteine lyase/cysteine desulfurase
MNRSDFPILQSSADEPGFVYLDSAATTQKPNAVIDAVSNYYRTSNANVHRAAHKLSALATQAFEAARENVRAFINAGAVEEIVFTRGTTEAINLIAAVHRGALSVGDEILISHLEHHSNIVPWQMLAAATGARLTACNVLTSGELDLDDFHSKLSNRTRIVAIGHVSNALGTVNPIADIVSAGHAAGALVVVDGAQAVAHMPVDVSAMDCDFYAFSGLPFKFEAGTPNIAGAIGLSAAIDYLHEQDWQILQAAEQELLSMCIAELQQMPEVQLIGTPKHRAGVVSFLVDGSHPHDIGTLLDQQGVSVRTGHHCTMPLMQHLNIPGTVRASFAMYNDADDVAKFAAAMRKTLTFV